MGSHHYLVLMELNLKLRKQRKPLESTKRKLRLNKLMEKGVRVKSQRELGTRFTQVAHKREEGVVKA